MISVGLELAREREKAIPWRNKCVGPPQGVYSPSEDAIALSMNLGGVGLLDQMLPAIPRP